MHIWNRQNTLVEYLSTMIQDNPPKFGIYSSEIKIESVNSFHILFPTILHACTVRRTFTLHTFNGIRTMG